MQDSKGYIWIGTEQGLVRYDGSVPKVFGAKDSLPEKAVYAVREDKYGQLWIATSKNRILYFKNNVLSQIPLSIPLVATEKSSTNVNYLFSFLGNDIYVHTAHQLYVVNIVSKNARYIPRIAVNDDLVLLKSGKNLLPLNSNRLGYNPNWLKTNKKFSTILIKEGKKNIRFTIPQKNNSDLHWRILSSYANGSSFFTINNKLIKIAAGHSYEVFEMPASIISLYTDKDGGLWAGTIKNGVFYFPNADIGKTPIISLNSFSVSGICEDRERNIWCTTLEDGVYASNSKYIVQYSNRTGFSGPPTFLKKVGGKLFVSTALDGLFVRTGSDNFIKTPIRQQVHHLFYKEGKYVIGQNSTTLASDINFRNINVSLWSYIDNYRADAIYESTVDKTRPVFSITYNKILRHSKNTGYFFTQIRSSGKCIQYLDSNTLIYGCANGLYTVNIQSRQHQRIPGIERTVTKILSTHNEGIWIATKGDGLYHYKDGQYKRMDRLLGLPTDVFYDLDVDTDGKIWIATNLGILSLSKNNRGGYSSQHFGTSNGLSSNEIYKLAIYQEQVFFLSPKGLARFPVRIPLSNTEPPTFLLVKLTVNQNQLPTTQKSVRLAHSSNNLSFVFSVLSYKNGSQQLIYRLKPEEPFMKVNGNEIILQNLKPDDYALTVYALNSDGVKSREPYLLKINILPPFWQTWWFLLLVVFLLAVLFLWLREKQSIRIRKREEEKTRINSLIAQSKLSALQARMNPHFIFNAINSIQNYILKNQPEAAQSYLTKFSRLVRMVLSQSALKTITLKEEIETLSLYIELEKLRFKEAFDYEVRVAASVNTQAIYLPTMLIQPYVENAIWHGLMNLKGSRKGILLIDIATMDNELYIRVEDNGVGRIAASAYRKDKNYVSAGMMLTEERLRTLQDIFPNGNFKVMVSDLDIGTRVEIVLSLSHDDHFNENANGYQ